MARTLDDMLAVRPVDRAAVDAHKAKMLDEIRTYRESKDLGDGRVRGGRP